MNSDEIKQLLLSELSAEEIKVTEENGYFQVTVVSEQFQGMRRVKREQIVYAPLMAHIADNRIHAIQINAFTQEEWLKHRKLNG